MEAFIKENMELTAIGKITSGERVIIKEGERRELLPPDVDELYKALER